MQEINNFQTKDKWIPLQIKVFSRWVSRELNGLPNSNIQDITKDLSNGVALVELAEVLTQKRAPHLWDHKPTTKTENVMNCDLAIDMFSRDGVKLDGITGKEISDNDQKEILSFIWSLVLHYSIENSMSDHNRKINDQSNVQVKPNPNAQSDLISWASNCTEKYNNISNFEPFELFMCALLDSFYPLKIKFNTLKADDHQHNAKLAFDVMNDLGIVCLVYPEDLKKYNYKVDEMTLLTQLAAAKYVLDINEIQKKGLEIAFSTPEELRVKKEEAKVREELQKQMELKDQERQKELEDAKLKAQEAEKMNAIQETRLRIQEIINAKEKEERIKNEEAIIKAQKESDDKIREAREKAEEEIRKKVEAEYRERMNEAEARAKEAEESKLVLEKKLKDVEKEKAKLQKENDDDDTNDTTEEKHKEKHVRIKVKVHHNNENEEHKKFKIGIKIKEHNDDKNEHHHLVCKNVKVIRNGKVVPSEIEEGSVQKDGEKQSFHVKLL